MSKYAIGLDFGTLSVRAFMIDIHTGEEAATSVFEYPHGVMETALPSGRKLPAGYALQYPQDYMTGLVQTITAVMGQTGASPEDVVGIGVDFTASTILPVREDKVPLCLLPEYAEEPHAYVKLWKHHGGEEEAAYIDQVARTRGEYWHTLYGGKVSSEWMIPKILETLHHAPHVYEAADRYMEALDWIIWQLTGIESRSVCGAGYKAFYHHKQGYPPKEFFKALDPRLEHLIEEKMTAPVKGIGEPAGELTEDMAAKLGLLPGTPVGTGIVDAHSSLVGAGIAAPGTMMIIVGTSSCHILLSELEVGVPGNAGVVKDGIMPGYFAYESGQSCVGDYFAWFVRNCVPAEYKEEAEARGISVHQLLTEKASVYKAGQSGLLALDWYNGVRSPLMDFNLNGLILGMNLLTKPEEIYRAFLEATAYGTRMILEGFEQAGISVDRIVLSGGIPRKNQLLVQIYADVCNREIQICQSNNASAMGAAILGVAAAPESVTGYKNVIEVAEKLGRIGETVYLPDPENAAVYDALYEEYKTLHEYFGKGGNDVMKRLNALRSSQKHND